MGRKSKNDPSDWITIKEKFNARTWSDLADIFEIDISDISRFKNGSKRITEGALEKIIRTISPKFANPEEALIWLEEIGWVDKYHNIKEFVNQSFTDITNRHYLYTLPKNYIPRPEYESQIINSVSDFHKKSNELPNIGIIISGLGGIGKTTLIKSCLKKENELPKIFNMNIFWINCENQIFDELLIEIANEVNIQIELAESTVILKNKIRGGIKNTPSLFVFDGVTHIGEIFKLQELLDPRYHRQIISTRESPKSNELKSLRLINLPIDEFTSNEAISYLEANSDFDLNNDNSDIHKLFEKIGKIPLALSIISGTKSFSNISWNTLLNYVTNHPIPSLESPNALVKDQSIKLSFDISYHLLNQKSPDAANAFCLLGVFGRNEGGTKTLRNLFQDIDSPFDLILQQLSRINFLTTNGNRWNIHPLIHQYVKYLINQDQDKLSRTRQQYLNFILETDSEGIDFGDAIFFLKSLFQDSVFSEAYNLGQKLVNQGRILKNVYYVFSVLYMIGFLGYQLESREYYPYKIVFPFPPSDFMTDSNNSYGYGFTNPTIENLQTPTTPFDYNRRGNIKFGQRDIEGAIQEWEQAIQLDPDYPFSIYNYYIGQMGVGNDEIAKNGLVEFKEQLNPYGVGFLIDNLLKELEIYRKHNPIQ